MKIIATILFDLEDIFKERKPDIDMFNRFLKSRIHQGFVNEGNMRGRVVMNIKDVKLRSMEID